MLYLGMKWDGKREWSGSTLKYPTDKFLSCWAHLESWILCLVCPGICPKSKGAMVVYKNKSQSVGKHFPLLVGKVMLHLVEFLRWHHRGREGGDLWWPTDGSKGRWTSLDTPRALNLAGEIKSFSGQHKLMSQWCQGQNKSLFVSLPFPFQVFLNIGTLYLILFLV